MDQHRKHPLFFIFHHQTAMEQVHPLVAEGYLGMPPMHLPIFREKNGTSVSTKSSSIYSAFYSPPPIRPMVEKSRIMKYQKKTKFTT